LGTAHPAWWLTRFPRTGSTRPPEHGELPGPSGNAVVSDPQAIRGVESSVRRVHFATPA
jgi:hypothetical protein